MSHLAKLYAPYTFYAARFDVTQTQSLMRSLVPEERAAFVCDLEGLRWEEYLSGHVLGLLRYVLKGRHSSREERHGQEQADGEEGGMISR